MIEPLAVLHLAKQFLLIKKDVDNIPEKFLNLKMNWHKGILQSFKLIKKKDKWCKHPFYYMYHSTKHPLLLYVPQY